ncbi:MAG: sugar phosphate nucleotidyltransferase [Candidatus Omnitrophota bacterium]
MKYAIILAGGSGSRFWPLSRRSRPKQFLRVCSKRPMITEALERAASLVGVGNVYLAANALQKNGGRGYLRGLGVKEENIFLEPHAKNTFAPIAFLTSKIYSRDKDAVIAVLPCDHFIKGSALFRRAALRAFSVAERGYIVTMGIRPLRPETGYGYIKRGRRLRGILGGSCFKVERFIEKPPLETARKFCRDKKYYWNSGMFIFKADVMLREIKRILPQAYRLLARINNYEDVKKAWAGFGSFSIDCGIMEKTSRAAVLPSDYRWTDLGSWLAMREVMSCDRNGNVLRGNCLDIGSRNVLVWAGKRLIATLGLKDIIVVDSDDALLVCHKDNTQDVRKLTQLLKRRKLEKYL